MAFCRFCYVKDWGEGRTHPSHDLDIRGPGSITGCDGVHDAEYVPLHHAHEVEVVFTLGHVAEVLDEVHYIRAVVHVILDSRPFSSLD